MEITNEELNERIAILKRFKALLLEQRKKFQEYLDVLEKQGSSIEAENAESIASHAAMEQSIVKTITNLQKVIIPFSKMYDATSKGIDRNEKNAVSDIQNDLNRLQTKVLAQNKQNRDLLRTHIVQIRKQLDNFKNPYKNISSIYSRRAAQGSFIALDV